MKNCLIVLAFCALIALAYSAPAPQEAIDEEEAVNRPIWNALSSAYSSAYSTANQSVDTFAKRVAQTIENGSSSMTNGINNAAQSVSGAIAAFG